MEKSISSIPDQVQERHTAVPMMKKAITSFLNHSRKLLEGFLFGGSNRPVVADLRMRSDASFSSSTIGGAKGAT